MTSISGPRTGPAEALSIDHDGGHRMVVKLFRIHCFGLSLAALALAGLAGTAAAQTDLQRVYRAIASKRFVDLTHAFDADTPVWSGFGQARMTPARNPETREPYT